MNSPSHEPKDQPLDENMVTALPTTDGSAEDSVGGPIPYEPFDPAAEYKPEPVDLSHNSVTGLPDYDMFKRVAAEMIDDHSGKFALIFGDVNGLKDRNEKEGHAGGNKLLTALGDNLMESADLANVSTPNPVFLAKIFHIHGDEVVIISGETDETKLQTMTIGLEESMEELGTSASFGSKVHDGEDLATLLDIVDKRMLEHKAARKDAGFQEQLKAATKIKRAAHGLSELTGKYSGIQRPRR